MRTETNVQTGKVTQHEDAPLPTFTPEEIESSRIRSITDKANAYVLSKYSELKQRKYMSIAISLDDKQYRLNITLSQTELDLLQEIRDVNAWIASVRDTENAAIADGVTLAEEMTFPV